MTQDSGLLQSSVLSPNKMNCAKQRLPRKRLLALESQEEKPQKKRVYNRKEQNNAKNPVVVVSRIDETKAETASDEDSDHDELYDQEQSGLSAYELERLRNIKENTKFLSCLNLFEAASNARPSKQNRSLTRGIKREKPKKQEVEHVRRRSMRLQRIDPSGAPLPDKPELLEPMVEEHPMKPPGPFEMIPSNQADKETVGMFMTMWKSISQEEVRSCEKPQQGNLKKYASSLKAMTLKEEAVAKVVQNRIFSVAIHPSRSHALVAAGDKWGQVGLWGLDFKSSDDGVCLFMPHSRPVSCMSFSAVNAAQLFSLSYDGTVRCGDVSHGVFDEVFRDENDSFSSFDFLSADSKVLLVSHWDASISLVDQRTPGTSCELHASLSIKSVRTVHVHPLQRDLCVVAGARDVCIYDIRQLKQKRNQPILSLPGHTKSVASAYFSPSTGNRILTTCADDCIRVYDSSNMGSVAPLLKSIRHNNNTGRWLTRFRAAWDPKQEDCFVVGSMARPRQIEVFHESGELLHSFQNAEFLGSVCSINAMHPNRQLLVGGNSSGRLHVFQD
ncbi:WD repeat-containing protein 76 [Bombina bombina]|uniref:WD repeat-containing protein 76 n=1 Tax=Bombina bombina TaxID=8345 RepID=UPI00235A484C|nr:WD repeat-containing protein 76 [Bombina bombina]